MIYLAIILFIVAVVLLTRLVSLKREIKKINKQLQIYNNRQTNKKMDVALLDGDIEDLGMEINKLIDLYVKENMDKIRSENELKQAVANMSHDLRTPLTSILGYIQMAESDDVTEVEKQEFLSIAKQRAKRLETLVKDFFELSVIESMDYELKSGLINIKHLTTDILLSFYDRFNQRNMEPTISMPEDLYIESDESAVTRVIENLVYNAITHSDGNIIVSLEEKNSTIRLTVKNDAHSLTLKDVKHFFDRFYMADQSRSSKSTGLGLSIAKSFMVKMDGGISAELTDGQLSIACEWKKAKN